MPVITLVEHSGERHTIAAKAGTTLMANALNNAVPGIDADCGGACACGTCHCFINEEWHGRVGNAYPMEECMLSMRPDRTANSRLACRVDVSDDMDGLVVHLPEYQM